MLLYLQYERICPTLFSCLKDKIFDSLNIVHKLLFRTFLSYFNVFNNSCYQVESSKKSTLAEGKKKLVWKLFGIC